MQHAHHATVDTPRGISLLVVILTSSLMLVTALALGGFALSTLKNSQIRSDAVKGLYNAESAFACVKYWLGRDYRNFTHQGVAITCESGTHTFTLGNNYIINGSTGTADFMIGETRVEVIRDIAKSVGGRFDGKVRVYGRSTGGGEKLAERYQEYDLKVISHADFMFVVDRSGSIAGNRTTPNISQPWGKLVLALADGVAYLSERVYHARIGVVSYGLGIGDMGRPVNVGCTSAGMGANCLREPDVPLVDPKNDPSNTLPYNGGTFNSVNDDELGGMIPGSETDNFTNLSLGISMAGLELLRKYYPAGNVQGSPGYSAGVFERAVAFNNLNLTSYVDHMRGRTDAPKYMIIITDGEPNALISFNTNDYEFGYVNSSNNFISSSISATTSSPGDPKMFRTRVAGGGLLLNTNQYMRCNDLPTSPLASSEITLTGSVQDYAPAMCNAQQIRKVFTESHNIEVAVLAIDLGGQDKYVILDWLENKIATDPRLFRVADTFDDVYDALNEIIDEITLRESR